MPAFHIAFNDALAPGLVEFLLARVEDGYAFPLNPALHLQMKKFHEIELKDVES